MPECGGLEPQSCALPQQYWALRIKVLHHSMSCNSNPLLAGCDQVLNQVKIPDVMQALQDL